MKEIKVTHKINQKFIIKLKEYYYKATTKNSWNNIMSREMAYTEIYLTTQKEPLKINHELEDYEIVKDFGEL